MTGRMYCSNHSDYLENFVLNERAYNTIIVRVSSTVHTLYSVFNSFKYSLFDSVVCKMWTAINSMIVYLDRSGTECL